ncbi:MAG: ABC transporter permease [Rikenella sp.]|nr:ABC transporter permease [Rikenella sp.]
MVVLIGLFVFRELSTNRFHRDIDQIYKICGWSTPYPLVPTIAESVPEIEAITNVARVKSRFAITWDEQQREVYMQEGYLAVDPGFFEIFTFPVVAGNVNDPLPDARSVALVESTAKALFGDENPIGQSVMTTGWGGSDSYVVTAVMADIPINSSIRFSALFRINPSQPFGTSTIGQYWKGGLYEVFARVPRGIDVEALNAKMQDVVRRNGNLDIGAEKVVLYPFADVYFDKAHLWSQFKGGEYGKVMIMMAIGCIILLMAIINFFNLSTCLL